MYCGLCVQFKLLYCAIYIVNISHSLCVIRNLFIVLFLYCTDIVLVLRSLNKNVYMMNFKLQWLERIGI